MNTKAFFAAVVLAALTACVSSNRSGIGTRGIYEGGQSGDPNSLVAGAARLEVDVPNPVVVKTGDNANIDAFGRMRVSNPFTLFDSKQTHGGDTNLVWSQVGSNSVFTYVRTNAAVEMAVDTNGDFAIRQTKHRFNYQPGKGQEVMITFVASTNYGVYSKVGYFNTDPYVWPYDLREDGLYFCISNGIASFNIAKNGSVTSTIQRDWNIDKLDGTGASGVKANWDKAQILFIDFEWLGVGRVRFGFVIDGIVYYAHQFLHANNVASVYMSDPNHSIRYEIRSTGGTGVLQHICSTVLSEGGFQGRGGIFSQYATNSYTVGASDKGVSLMAFRLATNGFGGDMTIEDISIFSSSLGSTEAILWELVVNPSHGTVFSWNDYSDAATIQWASSPNVVTTGGTVIASGFLTGTQDQTTDIPPALYTLGVTIDGVADELVLRVTGLGANNDAIYSLVTWREN